MMVNHYKYSGFTNGEPYALKGARTGSEEGNCTLKYNNHDMVPHPTFDFTSLWYYKPYYY